MKAHKQRTLRSRPGPWLVLGVGVITGFVVVLHLMQRQQAAMHSEQQEQREREFASQVERLEIVANRQAAASRETIEQLEIQLEDKRAAAEGLHLRVAELEEENRGLVEDVRMFERSVEELDLQLERTRQAKQHQQSEALGHEQEHARLAARYAEQQRVATEQARLIERLEARLEQAPPDWRPLYEALQHTLGHSDPEALESEQIHSVLGAQKRILDYNARWVAWRLEQALDNYLSDTALEEELPVRAVIEACIERLRMQP